MEFKILVEGYAKKTKSGFVASPTTTLVKEKGLKIIVDPGANKRLLLQRLKKEKTRPEYVDIVVLTHYHLDHTLNAALFPNAKFVDSSFVYDRDKEYEHGGYVPGTRIEIMPTPGHADELCALVLKTKDGTVVVASDNFWWTSDENQTVDINKDDVVMTDKKKLIESRKKILKIADYIIPGHGKMFKVKR